MTLTPLTEYWFLGESKRGNAGMNRNGLTFKGAFEAANEKTLWIVDACHEYEILGHMFIHGKEIKLHVIRDGRLVRFEFTDEFDFFIYPYDPMQHQLQYTSPAPSAACELGRVLD